MNNSAKEFNSMALAFIYCKYGIVLAHSYNCYPRGNGQAKSSNKNFTMIIKKTIDENNKVGIIILNILYGLTTQL